MYVVLELLCIDGIILSHYSSLLYIRRIVHG